MIFSIILMIGLAWLVQIILGYFQVRHFNQRFREMRRLGRVAIGRLTGKFRAGTVVLIAIDARNTIIRVEKMQGVTIFSRLRPLKGLEGKNLLDLQPEDIAGYNRLTAKAIQDAVNNVKTIAKGGDVPVKKTWLDKMLMAK
ncbi:transcriptional regulator GutM [Melghirimyces algeriensis]|uniref:DNA-binding transcriptional regulator of glucitol operon n=1 Tax=Melghirimyces algeriensis TaxID=910412 RepID=A0A521DJ22_9BACL|nr:transcriptional regulator GutM [Melghirimyces algeriensis]SMO71646.1 DNA-binding transcriptional regulator of glucitol operon [Melghirimyces algeriensis]